MNREFYKKQMDIEGGRLIRLGQNLIDAGRALIEKSKYISISVLTRWCNDAMIAPFFLNHYSWADEIVILLDSQTVDESRQIIGRYRNARIAEFEFSNGFNGREASELINAVARELQSDWIIGVDADEFVFLADGRDIREVLAEADGNLIYADFWQIYRHRTEMDLDPTLPALWLRRHGDPNRSRGANANYQKPIIVKSGLNIRWGVGLHNYEENPRMQVASVRFDGAHWRMADPALAVARRLRGRRENVSPENIEKGWSCNNFDITEEQIRAQCAEHLDDPQLF